MKYIQEPRRVSRDGFVSYDGVRYGVPWRYSGRDVTVREVNGRVEILVDGTPIAKHEKIHRSRANENVLFLGPPGVGKSHLAVALALEAIRLGVSVYFVSLTYMIEDLRKAYAENRLDKRLRVYNRPKILVIDEVGFLPLDRLAANLFLQVVSARYERGSILMTSNKSFGEWGELMGDPILATAILDRLLHHSHVVNIRGNSYRLKEKIRTGIYGTPQTTK